MFSRNLPKVPKAVSVFLHKITTSLRKLGSKNQTAGLLVQIPTKDELGIKSG